MGHSHKGDDQQFSWGVISTQLSQLKCSNTFNEKENNQIKCHIACSILLTRKKNEKPIFFHYISQPHTFQMQLQILVFFFFFFLIPSFFQLVPPNE